MLVRENKKAVSLLHIETEPLLPFDGTELIMNSAVTKIISLADPNNKLIIYDGRVGSALGHFASLYAREKLASPLAPRCVLRLIRRIRRMDRCVATQAMRLSPSQAYSGPKRQATCRNDATRFKTYRTSRPKVRLQFTRDRSRPVHVGLLCNRFGKPAMIDAQFSY